MTYKEHNNLKSCRISIFTGILNFILLFVLLLYIICDSKWQFVSKDKDFIKNLMLLIVDLCNLQVSVFVISCRCEMWFYTLFVYNSQGLTGICINYYSWLEAVEGGSES